MGCCSARSSCSHYFPSLLALLSVFRLTRLCSGGDQPRGTLISGNIAREIGIWEKQSSFVFQAECGLSTISRNIAYNGPRAGAQAVGQQSGSSGCCKTLVQLLLQGSTLTRTASAARQSSRT